MIRIDHWSKNIFMLPGFFLGIALLKPTLNFELLLNFSLAFISLGLASSANYVINEFNDRKFDAFHPTKSSRVAVSNVITIRAILITWVGLLALSLLITILFLTYIFSILLLLLVAFGLAYNLKPIRLKDIPIVDVLWESLNGPIRVFMGWLVVSQSTIPPISYLLAFYCISVFLMSSKRISEFRLFRILNSLDNLFLYRSSFRYYNEERLLIQSFVSALLAIYFFTIFSFKWNLNFIIIIPAGTVLLSLYLGRVLNQPLAITETPHGYFGNKGKLIIVMAVFVAVLLIFFDKNVFLAEIFYSYKLNLDKIIGL